MINVKELFDVVIFVIKLPLHITVYDNITEKLVVVLDFRDSFEIVKF